MNLKEAVQLIESSSQAMNRAYKRTVFDEFALVAMEDRNLYLVWYSGPRQDTFRATFIEDTAALQADAFSGFTREWHAGDFEFTASGIGSQSEAFLVTGSRQFLLCTNTKLSMREISHDPLWLGAQVPFADMAERFQRDPLVLEGPFTGPSLGRLHL
jgi:hypothetical protein